MNPLTLVKRIQNINSREAALGISEDASWHAKYKDSAYVFVGGIPFDLTEGDLLAIFAQYGEIVDVNLVRDQGTGKSKGFAFIAYEDQRSTNLAVDNLNGAQVLGRVIRVDHVSKYKKKEEEDEEERQKKREERGVCRAFQRGNCTRGDGCKFSHDEQRAANTGWGAEDKDVRWGHDKYDDPKTRGEKNSGHPPREPYNESKSRDGHRSYNVDSRTNAKEREIRNDAKGHKSSRRYHDDFEPKLRDLHDDRGDINVRRYGSKNDYERSSKDYNRSGEGTHEESRTNRNDDNSREPKARDDRDRREQKRSRRHDDDDDIKPRSRDGHDRRGKNKSRRA